MSWALLWSTKGSLERWSASIIPELCLIRYSLYHPGPNNSTGSDDFLDIPYISYWIYAVSSAPLYIAIFAQFMCSSVVFSLTLTLLVPVMLLSLGAALQSNLAYYYYYYLLNKQGQEIPHYVHIQLAGSLGAFLSVVCVLFNLICRLNHYWLECSNSWKL